MLRTRGPGRGFIILAKHLQITDPSKFIIVAYGLNLAAGGNNNNREKKKHISVFSIRVGFLSRHLQQGPS